MIGKNEQKILADIANTDIYSFENYCGSCDNFPLNEDEGVNNIMCPFRNVVNAHTNWKSLGCNYFWN